jgi:Lariat debranching enzyme, C-terminal domain
VRHDPSSPGVGREQPSSGPPPPSQAGNNPDEIAISDEEVEGQGELDAQSGDGPATAGPNESSVAITPQNPDEITLEDEIETVEPPPLPPRETKFLALDKCLPRRQFLEASRSSLPAVGDTKITSAIPKGGRHPRAARERPVSRDGRRGGHVVVRPRMARDNARLPAVPLAAPRASDISRSRRGWHGGRSRVGLGACAYPAEARRRVARRGLSAVRAGRPRWGWWCASADRGVCGAA